MLGRFNVELKPLGVFYFSGNMLFALAGVIGFTIHEKDMLIFAVLGMCIVQLITTLIVLFLHSKDHSKSYREDKRAKRKDKLINSGFNPGTKPVTKGGWF